MNILMIITRILIDILDHTKSKRWIGPFRHKVFRLVFILGEKYTKNSDQDIDSSTD